MQLVIREMLQTSSVGYVVTYAADFETIPSTDVVTVSIENTIPPDADPDLVNLAQKYIADAFNEVLNPRGLSASVTLRDLVIHDVDFSEQAFRRFTISGLRTLLEESSQ